MASRSIGVESITETEAEKHRTAALVSRSVIAEFTKQLKTLKDKVDANASKIDAVSVKVDDVSVKLDKTKAAVLGVAETPLTEAPPVD